MVFSSANLQLSSIFEMSFNLLSFLYEREQFLSWVILGVEWKSHTQNSRVHVFVHNSVSGEKNSESTWEAGTLAEAKPPRPM